MNLNKILILGGGTAGWMVANLLQYKWSRKHDVEIKVIESSTIGTVGVGEGTTPRVKDFFDSIGILESDWMPSCNATYKCGVDFPDWYRGEKNRSYFHPFFSNIDKGNIQTYIRNCHLKKKGADISAHPDHFFVASSLFKLKKSPLPPPLIKEKNYYGYHFDAALLGEYLKKLGVSRGVKLIDDKVEEIVVNNKGNISEVKTALNGVHAADFFIDCSGFKGLLIQDTLKEKNISCSEYLLNDSAVAIPSNYMDDTKISSHTESKALKYGWSWKIPLINRVGNGYVYCSKYISKEEAEAELREELGVPQETKALHLHWEPGRIENHWKKNCLAVGLSQGFLEPLEAPMLNITQFTIDYFMALVDKYGLSEEHQNKFNKKINSLIDSTRDYLQLHYLLNNRSDTQYWIDCRNNENVSESLKNIINSWNSESVFHESAINELEKSSYGITSWYCILSGMEQFKASSNKADSVDIEKTEQVKSNSLRMAELFKDHKTELLEIYKRP